MNDNQLSPNDLRIEEHIQRHEKELNTLRERSHKIANEFTVSENKLTTTITKLTETFVELQAEYSLISNRIPKDLVEQLIRFEMKIDGVLNSYDQFVAKSEWMVLKNEHELLKKLIFSAVGMILLAVIGTIITLAMDHKL